MHAFFGWHREHLADMSRYDISSLQKVVKGMPLSGIPFVYCDTDFFVNGLSRHILAGHAVFAEICQFMPWSAAVFHDSIDKL